MKQKCILLFTLIMLAYGRVWGIDGEPLVMMGDSACPPFEFTNQYGHPDGFNIEIAKAVMEKAGLPYVIRLESRENAMTSLDVREADILPGMLYTYTRRDQYVFSSPHSTISYQVVCRKNGVHPTTLADIKGKRIIVPRAQAIIDILKEEGCGQNLIESYSIGESMNDFVKSNADYMIIPASVARLFMYSNGIENLDLVDIGIPRLNNCFVTNDADITERLNSALAELKSNGTYQRIYNKWFCNDPEPEYGQSIIFVIIISVILIIALTVIIYKAGMKKMVNKNRKQKRMLDNMKDAIKIADVSMWEYDCDTETDIVFNERMVDYKQFVEIDIEEIKKVVNTDDYNSSDMASAFDIMQLRINAPFKFDVRVAVPYDKDWQYCTIKGHPCEYDNAGNVTKYLCVKINKMK